MNERRILVTGGAGFIGSHLVEKLHAEGSEVAALDNLSSGKRKNLPEAVKLYDIDLRDDSKVLQTFRDFRPTHVLHQAAQASVTVSVAQPRFDAEVNLIGGINLLEAARTVGTQQFIFASTGGAIYGEVPEDTHATEEWSPQPKSPYAASKAGFELYLQVYSKTFGISSVTLRYANVYGPRQDPHGEAGVVSIFTKRLLGAEEVTLYAKRKAGDEGCIRDYIFVGDVVKANLLALELNLEGTYNVSTGKGISTATLLRSIAQTIGCTPQVKLAPPRPGDLEVSIIDSTRLESLGWQVAVPLSEGIQQTVEWFRAHY